MHSLAVMVVPRFAALSIRGTAPMNWASSRRPTRIEADPNVDVVDAEQQFYELQEQLPKFQVAGGEQFVRAVQKS
jgi:hypothetical protein